jgi:hypothetical protein
LRDACKTTLSNSKPLRRLEKACSLTKVQILFLNLKAAIACSTLKPRFVLEPLTKLLGNFKNQLRNSGLI